MTFYFLFSSFLLASCAAASNAYAPYRHAPPNVGNLSAPYQCGICRKEIKTLQCSKYHTKNARCATAKYGCGYCTTRSRSKESSRKHIKLRHPEKRKTLIIDYCPDGPDSKTWCAFCEKNFSNMRYLRKHIELIHTAEDVYSVTMDEIPT